MYSTPVLIAFTSFFLQNFAQATSACSGQQFNDVPGFPASKSGCYPLNYYQTSDLGSTSPSDAKIRCQQLCTSMGVRCESVVAQVNYAPDTQTYPSGTCFFYAPGSTPNGPRQCGDAAYLLQGYVKDTTLDCFTSSLSSASKFCSSYLSIPVVTSTVTSTPPVLSTTATVTTSSVISTTKTTTTTPTITLSATTTTTVIVATSTSVETSMSTTVITSTNTRFSTVTVTTTVAAKRKRVLGTIPPPACVTPGTPATRISAACSCLSVKASTTKTTTTLTARTSTLTITTTTPVTVTQTVTVTAPSVSTTITGTATTGSTTTVTSTSISVQSLTVQTSTTITITTTTTTTSSSAPTCTAFYLQAQGGNFPGTYLENEPNGGNAVGFRTAKSAGTLYTLVGGQLLQANDPTILWSASHTSGYAYIYEANAATNAINGVGPLTCSSSIPPGTAGYPGTITCVGNNQNTFETCSGSNYLSINAPPLYNGCTAITLVGSC